MTDTRQALEEAFKVVFPPPASRLGRTVMDDLVERLRRQAHICQTSKTIGSITRYRSEAAMTDAASRIQALETSLAEAEGRVIAEVAAWLRGQADWHDKNDDGWSGFDRIAQGYREAVDALETGEWKK